MADPGFPVGGRGPHREGGMDSCGGYVSEILYIKWKFGRMMLIRQIRQIGLAN